MKIDFHYYKQGQCWRFVPSFDRHWHNKLWYFNFWRLQISLDFRKNWLMDMVRK